MVRAFFCLLINFLKSFSKNIKNHQIDKEKSNVLTKYEFVKFLSTHLNKGTEEEVILLIYFFVI